MSVIGLDARRAELPAILAQEVGSVSTSMTDDRAVRQAGEVDVFKAAARGSVDMIQVVCDYAPERIHETDQVIVLKSTNPIDAQTNAEYTVTC